MAVSIRWLASAPLKVNFVLWYVKWPGSEAAEGNLVGEQFCNKQSRLMKDSLMAGVHKDINSHMWVAAYPTSTEIMRLADCKSQLKISETTYID